MNQEQAIAILKSGDNVFLTGSAGTGKTYVLNKYIEYLKARKIPVSITASTGIAATHLQGTTIHAWSGIGIKDSLNSRQLKELKDKKYLKKHIEKTKVLIIDEISMLHKKQFDMVNEVMQYFRENDKPFGGIQVILCGDFFQLPPIGTSGEINRDKFCFMSQSWLNANLSICYLTDQFRQTDTELNQILNEIRSGVVTDRSIALLNNSKEGIDVEDPTRLYTHNLDVDRINTTHIAAIKGRKKLFKAKVKGNLKLAESIKRSIMAPESLELKKDAKVMFVKNNYEKGYLNGSLGTIIKYDDEGIPVVRLNNGYEITAEPEDWRIEDETGKLLVSYVQVPLRLAWAITVHKSQGMTLDGAVMDLSKTFEKGQGYVALSRIKGLDGLELIGFNQTALQVDGLALKADRRFQELSTEVEQIFEQDVLDIKARNFVKKCGGISNKDEIQENRKNLEKGVKVTKKSTYLITKQLIDKGHSLEDIVIERDLTIGTVSTHLIKITELYPKTDLSRFKPDSNTLNKVKNARNNLLKEAGAGERISLKPIFDILKGEVTYDQIKMALVFL